MKLIPDITIHQYSSSSCLHFIKIFCLKSQQKTPKPNLQTPKADVPTRSQSENKDDTKNRVHVPLAHLCLIHRPFFSYPLANSPFNRHINYPKRSSTSSTTCNISALFTLRASQLLSDLQVWFFYSSFSRPVNAFAATKKTLWNLFIAATHHALIQARPLQHRAKMPS
jgi:hypothetical protein